jgi:hypothetical protein
MVMTPYHPITQRRFRVRYSTSGANDDRRDDVEFVTDHNWTLIKPSNDKLFPFRKCKVATMAVTVIRAGRDNPLLISLIRNFSVKLLIRAVPYAQKGVFNRTLED